MKIPRPQTVRLVVEYLETLQLSVYGDCVNFESEIRTPGCRDYTAEDVIKLIKLKTKYPDGIPYAQEAD